MTAWWLAAIIPAAIHIGLSVGFIYGVLWAEARITTESETDE